MLQCSTKYYLTQVEKRIQLSNLNNLIQISRFKFENSSEPCLKPELCQNRSRDFDVSVDIAE